MGVTAEFFTRKDLQNLIQITLFNWRFKRC